MAMNTRKTPSKKEVGTLSFFIEKYIKKMGYSRIVIWEWIDRKDRSGHSYYLYDDGTGNVPQRLFNTKLELVQIVYSRYMNGHRDKIIKLEVV